MHFKCIVLELLIIKVVCNDNKKCIDMNKLKFLITAVLFSLLIISCGGDDVPEKSLDDYTGTYDCLKYTGVTLDSTFAVQQDLVVAVDPDNEENLLISNLSIPVAADGSFGPAELNSSMFIELYFDGDEIYFRMSPMLINGIALPCTFVGSK